MTTRSLVVHAGWAAIAAAAFMFGSLRDRGGRDGATDGGDGLPASKVSGGERARQARLAGSSGKSREGEMVGAQAGVQGAGVDSGGPLSEAQLKAIAHEAFRSGSPIARRAAFNRLLESLTADNAETIRGLLMENGVSSRGGEWRDFHYTWGTLDGLAAVKHSMETPESDMTYTMSGWASAYPEEARRFMEAIPADVKTDRELLKRSLVAGMADRDPNLATDFVFQLASQGDERAGGLLEVVTREVLSTQGTEEAATWSENLPEGAMKGAALDRVANSYVDRDPEAAASWAEQFVGRSYESRVIEEVGDEWAERNPSAAVDWLESLPAGGGQSAGLSSAYGEWAKRDPVAAGERLATMPRSSQRDSAISGYASTLSYRDPLSAIDWANSIANNEVRTSALTRAGQQLFRRDSAAARTWVSTSGLSPEAQKAVLNPPRRR